MDITVFHSIWTVLMFVLFIGIWAWAWSSRRKASFDDAARMPLEDDDQTLITRHGEKNNG